MNHETEDKRIFVMAYEKPVKAVIKMGVPVTLGMLIMVVYNLVDTYFIGMLNDDFQLAAINLSYPIMMVSVAIASIVGNGGASYIARCIGSDQKQRAEHTLTIGFELIFLSALILTSLGLFFLDPIVSLLGADESSFLFTKQYCFVMLIGSIFTMGNYAIGQLLRSEGSTMYSMIGMISGTLTNIVLDPVFIFGLNMKITGAAIATVLGNAVSVFLFLWFYLRKKTLLAPSIHLLKLDKEILKEIFLVGIPNTLEQLFATLAMIVNNNLAASYGQTTVAAMGVANKIISFGTYTYQGMVGGCQPLIGYNYGAKNFDRMLSIFKSSILVVSLIECSIILVFMVFAQNLIALFSESANVISIGESALKALMLMLPFVAITTIIRGTFNAMGKSMYAFGITMMRQLVLYIPFLLIFNHIWGFTGLIHAQPVEEVICMIFALGLISNYYKKNLKNQQNINNK